MMKSIAFATACSSMLFLAGCVSNGPSAAAPVSYLQVQKECENAKNAGKIATYRDEAICENNAERAEFAVGPMADLADLENAKKLQIGDEVDHHQISFEEANAETAAIHSQVISESNRRVAAAQQTAALQQEAAYSAPRPIVAVPSNGGRWAAFAAGLTGTPVVQAPAPAFQNTDCTSIVPGQVHCTTW